MNKELLPTLVLLFALFGGALYFSETLRSPFVSLLSTTKSTYHDIVASITNSIEEHFSQQQNIQALRSELEQYKKDRLVMQQLQAENSALLAANSSTFEIKPNVALVRTLSYVKFGDTRKIRLEMDDFNHSRVYGLVYNSLAAGIVVASDDHPIALLNGDIKSSYAVYVGKGNAPGIISGNNTDTLIVKFIPTWIPVNEGDEVITSGLDNLFFKGLKVGKVLSVSLSQGYQNAVVEPYSKANNPGYFHVIKRLH